MLLNQAYELAACALTCWTCGGPIGLDTFKGVVKSAKMMRVGLESQPILIRIRLPLSHWEGTGGWVHPCYNLQYEDTFQNHSWEDDGSFDDNTLVGLLSVGFLRWKCSGLLSTGEAQGSKP
jgi:hypothetical protein